MSTPPNYTILGNCNSANYGGTAYWNNQQGNVTSVGANGGSSFFGTYDQNGNVWEIIHYQSDGKILCYGGAFDSRSEGNSFGSLLITNSARINNIGFRVCANSGLNLTNFVTVSGTNNSDPSRDHLGAVNYPYQISKYTITNTQYVEFLNSVATSGTQNQIQNIELWPFNIKMRDQPDGGIVNAGQSPNMSYSVKYNFQDKPVNYVNWYNAARYVNWLYNNKNPTNIVGLNLNTTENGVYFLNFVNNETISPIINKDKYWLPTRSEWIKAA